MTRTSLLRLPPLALLFLLLLLGPAATVSRASEAEVVYGFPSHDQQGVAASAGPGVGGCGGGLGGACIAAGSAVLQLAPRQAVARGRQGLLQFGIPAGTIITGGTVRLRLRTRATGVVTRLLHRSGGRWTEQRRLRSSTTTARTVAVGAGGTELAVALTVETALNARAVRTAAENRVVVDEVVLRVRDLHRPAARWLDGALDDTGLWSSGVVCGSAEGTDHGLGVRRLQLRAGSEFAELEGVGAGRLRPHPERIAGALCVDTRNLDDGVYGTALTAEDGGGNVSERLTGLVRVDNRAPDVVAATPDDPEDRRPTIRLQALDRMSGVDRVDLTVDGVPLDVEHDGLMYAAGVPYALLDGRHVVEWSVSDKAGNRTSGRETFLIEDRSGPVIERLGPWGVAAADSVIQARVRDDGAGLMPDGVRIAVGGVDRTVFADWDGDVLRLSAAEAWEPGRHAIRIVAVDRSGNRTVATWDFEVLAPASPAPTPAPAPPSEPDPAPPGGDPAAAPESGEPETGARVPMQGVRIAAPASFPVVGGRGTLRLEVTRDGAPAAGLRLRVRWQGGRMLPSAVVDEEGVAEIPVIAKTDGILEVDGGGAAADIRVRVRARVTWSKGGRRARVGGALILRGSSAPARAGRGALEAFSAGRWLRVRPVVVGRDGRFSIRVVLPRTGRYLVRVQVHGGRSGTLQLWAG